MSDGISFKVDIANLKAEIAKEIQRQDELAKRVAEQMLLEGINAAQKLVLKDTSALNDSIATSSGVTRIAPCIYEMKLANGMDYGSAQETGPITSKRKWRFRPHIRPAVFIMKAKAREVQERVYGEG